MITFEEALKQSEEALKQSLDSNKQNKPTLILGNGFSIPVFAEKDFQGFYCNDTFNKLINIQNLFKALDTSDFEKVLSYLDKASIVAKAYGKTDYIHELEQDSEVVKEAFIKAITDNHPDIKKIGDHIDFGPNPIDFLNYFDNIFTLNYDVILYWLTIYGSLQKNDGFALGKDLGSNLFGPFQKNAYCTIFNIHGGLHLFEGGGGNVNKVLKGNDGIIENITTFINNRELPVYVAEGDSASKLEKIKSNAYLTHCLNTLTETTNDIFIFGHSADDNDEHIYKAAFTPKDKDSQNKHIFFGAYKPSDKDTRIFKDKLAWYSKLYANKDTNIEYTLFKSETAQVWEDKV